MKVFVTGGTGFVGAHLVSALQARGAEVTCLVRSPAKAEALGWRGVRLVRGDLTDAAALREGCRGAEIVYHLAGVVAARDLAGFRAANTDGTAATLAAATTSAPRRFVFVSSIAAAGPTTRGHRLTTGDEGAPVTNYGRSKLAAEAMVRAAPFPWVILRPPPVYGEWDREFLRLFQITRRGIAPVFGDGLQELSAIHAEDLAHALIAAGESPTAAGKSYYPAHPELLTSTGMAVAAGKAAGASPVVIRIPGAVARALLFVTETAARLTGTITLLTMDKAHEFLTPAWAVDSGPLTRDTGWRATIDLESGFRRTVNWYREKGWL